jgi:hypothetical protein
VWETSVHEWYRTTADGRPLGFEYERRRDGDTLRVVGHCDSRECRMVVVDRGVRSERHLDIGEDVRLRIPFERWAFQDRIRTGNMLTALVLRPKTQMIEELQIRFEAVESIEVAGKDLELFRTRIRALDGEVLGTLWVDAFGDSWRAVIRDHEVPVTLERTKNH